MLLLKAKDNEFSGINAGTMRISNQKNGMKNKIIHHESLTALNESYPVDALVELANDLISRQESKDSLICACKAGN